MDHEHYADEYIRSILERMGRIALVGLSANPRRPSHDVFLDLLRRGYNVVGVNPGLAGQQIAGANVYATLADCPGPIDLVDVFRNSEAAGDTVDEALAISPLPRVVWLQMGVINQEAAQRAQARGVKVVMDLCLKVELARRGLTARGS